MREAPDENQSEKTIERRGLSILKKVEMMCFHSKFLQKECENMINNLVTLRTELKSFFERDEKDNGEKE